MIVDLSEWGGGTIILQGVTSTDLTEDMFVLHDLHGEDNEDDDIEGGTSDDTMSGGTGADSFYFYEGHGDDTITDFDATQDKIHLTALAQTITRAQLQTAISAIEDDPNTPETESSTLIDLTAWGGGTITLEGITSTDLTEDMFVLDRIVGSDDSVDELQGGTSDDTMTGGTGADTFVFNEKSGADTITDFSTPAALTAGLSQRTYRCPACGLEIDRDLNAAHNFEQLTASSAATACGGTRSGAAAARTPRGRTGRVKPPAPDPFRGGPGEAGTGRQG